MTKRVAAVDSKVPFRQYQVLSGLGADPVVAADVGVVGISEADVGVTEAAAAFLVEVDAESRIAAVGPWSAVATERCADVVAQIALSLDVAELEIAGATRQIAAAASAVYAIVVV